VIKLNKTEALAKMAKSNGSKEKELQPVDIKYSEIANGQFADEVVVTLVSSIGNINMILPRSFLNKSKKTVKAIIIDQKKDEYLIGLPNETFTTGSRVWFPKSAILV
jgi:hypothetical protein